MKGFHIGIDLDNTLIDYTSVFYTLAKEKRLIDTSVEKNVKKIREAIRALPDGNNRWTALQGEVYSSHLYQTSLATGVGSFLRKMKEYGVKVSIISHKSIYPAIGPKIHLHDAAMSWLFEQSCVHQAQITPEDVYFEPTRDTKIDRIRQLHCTHFIDDLPEIFTDSRFPDCVSKWLYAPLFDGNVPPSIQLFPDWYSIEKQCLHLYA